MLHFANYGHNRTRNLLGTLAVNSSMPSRIINSTILVSAVLCLSNVTALAQDPSLVSPYNTTLPWKGRPSTSPYNQQSFEDSGPLPILDEPGAFPVSPPVSSVNTHPFLQVGETQFHHQRNLVPMMPQQKLSTESDPPKLPPQHFEDKYDERQEAIGNFMRSPGLHAGGNPAGGSGAEGGLTNPGGSYSFPQGGAPGKAAQSGGLGGQGNNPGRGGYGGSSGTPGGGLSQSDYNRMNSNISARAAEMSRNPRFVYSYYRRVMKEERRAYTAEKRAQHSEDRAEKDRAASDARYAARTAQYSYDRIFKAYRAGDPVAQQFMGRARKYAERARDDADRAQEDANKAPEEHTDLN